MYGSDNFSRLLVQPNWLKRFHSLSLLSDSCKVDCHEKHNNECNITWTEQQRKVLSGARLRTRSNNYVEDNVLNEEFLLLLEKGHNMLRRRPKSFPFQSIPVNCKLRVFSFLDYVERGKAAQVCVEWSVLMKSSQLWDSIDLTAFPHPRPRDDTDEALAAYDAYKCNLQKFLCFLTSIRTPIRRLRFAYDIGDHRDGWLEILQSFLRSMPCQAITFAEMNWTETPARPADLDLYSVTWCTSDYNDMMHRQRHRQRLFVKFFDFFTAIAPAVQHLVLPFDWSERSLQMLNRLSHLKVLVLEKYFRFQGLEQRLVDQLMQSTPQLTHLTLVVSTPSGHGLQLYKMHSSSLCFLDISQCRGFCLIEVNLPNLMELRVTRSPLFGPIVSNDQPNIPCFGDVIHNGTRRLQTLNFQKLSEDNRSVNSQKFDLVLQSVCCCHKHKLYK